MRNLKGAQGDEEALCNKAMHLRDEIDRAELARDKALAAHDKALAVSHLFGPCHQIICFV